jgi:hypothetical protein
MPIIVVVFDFVYRVFILIFFVSIVSSAAVIALRILQEVAVVDSMPDLGSLAHGSRESCTWRYGIRHHSEQTGTKHVKRLSHGSSFLIQIVKNFITL